MPEPCPSDETTTTEGQTMAAQPTITGEPATSMTPTTVDSTISGAPTTASAQLTTGTGAPTTAAGLTTTGAPVEGKTTLGTPTTAAAQPTTAVPIGCKTTSIGKEYSGSLSVTKSGLTCQHWDSNTPHTYVFYCNVIEYFD